MNDDQAGEADTVFVAESDGCLAYLVRTRRQDDARGIIAQMHQRQPEAITLRTAEGDELAAWELWCSGFGPGSEAKPAAISVADAMKALRARS